MTFQDLKIGATHIDDNVVSSSSLFGINDKLREILVRYRAGIGLRGWEIDIPWSGHVVTDIENTRLVGKPF